jgi:hypothetical protein
LRAADRIPIADFAFSNGVADVMGRSSRAICLALDRQRYPVLSAHYDKLSITRWARHWDETKVEGDVMKMDCAVSYMAGGKRRAVATINRDRDNVVAEVEFETELLLRPPPPVTLEAAEA